MKENEKALTFISDNIWGCAQVISMSSDSRLNKFLGLSWDNQSLKGVLVPCDIRDMIDADKPCQLLFSNEAISACGSMEHAY